MKRLITIAMILMMSLPVLAAPAAAQGNSEAAHACQQDGYRDLARSDGSGFANTGECARYAAQGGVLVAAPRSGGVGAEFPCHLALGGTKDLSGLDLSRCDLSGANLFNTNLTGTYLGGGKLSGANLIHATIHYTNLTSANLSGANLSGADLHYAVLIDANLSGANLSGATVNEVNLDGVTWGNTTCPDGTNSDHFGGTCEGRL